MSIFCIHSVQLPWMLECQISAQRLLRITQSVLRIFAPAFVQYAPAMCNVNHQHLCIVNSITGHCAFNPVWGRGLETNKCC